MAAPPLPAAVALPVWEALAFERFMPDGRTRPALIACGLKEEAGERRARAIVKAVGHPEVTERQLGLELIGTVLAGAFGCRVPSPMLVNLSPEYLAATADAYESAGVRPRPGLAFGSELMENITNVYPHARVQRDHVFSAAQAYAFDMAVQNVDRRTLKPNCAIAGGEGVVLFDFEKAFSFLIPTIGGAPNPWSVKDFGFHHDHIFYRWLKGEPIDWRRWVPQSLAEAVAASAELRNVVPPEWQDQLDEIVAHLQALHEHSVDFSDGLGASLK